MRRLHGKMIINNLVSRNTFRRLIFTNGKLIRGGMVFIRAVSAPRARINHRAFARVPVFRWFFVTNKNVFYVKNCAALVCMWQLVRFRSLHDCGASHSATHATFRRFTRRSLSWVSAKMKAGVAWLMVTNPPGPANFAFQTLPVNHV